MKEGRNTYPCQSVATPTYPSAAKLATFFGTCKNLQNFLQKKGILLAWKMPFSSYSFSGNISP